MKKLILALAIVSTPAFSQIGKVEGFAYFNTTRSNSTICYPETVDGVKKYHTDSVKFNFAKATLTETTKYFNDRDCKDEIKDDRVYVKYSIESLTNTKKKTSDQTPFYRVELDASVMEFQNTADFDLNEETSRVFEVQKNRVCEINEVMGFETSRSCHPANVKADF